MGGNLYEYALDLVVESLRGLRGALDRVLGDDGPAAERDLAATSATHGPPESRDPWLPRSRGAERVQDEGSLRRVLAAPAPLSNAYADDRLVLLTRDPHTLFVYWDLIPGAPQPPGAANASLVLRIYDLALLDFADAHPLHHHDLEVDRQVGSRYVQLDHAGRTYRAEIGWRWNDGRFLARARSAAITTPRAEASGAEPTRWMTTYSLPAPALGLGTSARRSAPHPGPPGAPTAERLAPESPSQRAPSSAELHRRGG